MMIINVFNTVTLFLYHQEIGKNSFRISKIKPFLNSINWKNINFPPQEQDYKTLEMNNKSIALNILQANEQKTTHYYKSEFNKTREKQVILLIIHDDERNSSPETTLSLCKKLKCFVKTTKSLKITKTLLFELLKTICNKIKTKTTSSNMLITFIIGI